MRGRLSMTAFGEGVLRGACIDPPLTNRNARDDFQLEVRDEAGILVAGRLHDLKHAHALTGSRRESGLDFNLRTQQIVRRAATWSHNDAP